MKVWTKCMTELNSGIKLNSGRSKVKHNLAHLTEGINKCFNHHGGGNGEGGKKLWKEIRDSKRLAGECIVVMTKVTELNQLFLQAHLL